MDEVREDSKYPQNYTMNQGFGSLQNPKVLVHNVPYVQSQQIVDEDEADDEVEEDEDETNGGDNEMNGSVQQNGDDDDDDREDNENRFNDNDVDDDDEDHSGRSDDVNLQRHPKKRKLKSLLSSYEFAPRVSLPAATSAPKSSFGGRNTLTDWSEHETFVLLEAWGDRFLQCGRKSLRSEEWQEVADKVSQESKIERTDSQCRNRLDTLKKKYKKEKANLEGSRIVNTKWVYFKKMDMLMSSNPHQGGVLRGADSGENTLVNLNSANGMDEMRDSGGNSNSQEGGDDDDDDDDSDLLPPKKSKSKGDKADGTSFRLLADSINKFSEIFEKIENSKIQQMIELEKMRMDFQRDLELQKRQILDRAQTEITKIRQGDYDENDVSVENASG